MFGSGLLATASLLASPALVPDEAVPGLGPGPGPVAVEAQAPAVAGPPDPQGPPAPDVAAIPDRFSFGRDVHAARWEMAAIGGVVLIPRIYRAVQAGRPFHFQSEGWFGRDTYELGMDKTLHAWKAYVVTDVVQSIIARRTGDPRSAAITAGIFGMGLTTLAEAGDGFSRTTGFSYEDEVAQVAGIGLSMVRNMTPGLRDKIDYRLQLTPRFDGELSTTRGRAANSRYLLALQLAGFDRIERTPWRFVELHFGYSVDGLRERERLRGDPLKRHVFVGVGFNVQQLFARHPRGTAERLGKGAFDYLQVPYTSINS